MPLFKTPPKTAGDFENISLDTQNEKANNNDQIIKSSIQKKTY